MENQDIAERIALTKLKRIDQLNEKLIANLSRSRIPASNACYLIMKHVEETPDYLITCLWKLPPEENPWSKPHRKSNEPGCCTIV